MAKLFSLSSPVVFLKQFFNIFKTENDLSPDALDKVIVREIFLTLSFFLLLTIFNQKIYKMALEQLHTSELFEIVVP